jgi:hypothetical protein
LTRLGSHGVFGHHTGHDQVVIPGTGTLCNEGCNRKRARVSDGSIQNVNPVVRPHPHGPLQGGAHPLWADGQGIDHCPRKPFLDEQGFLQGEFVETVHPERRVFLVRQKTCPLVDLECFAGISHLFDANENFHAQSLCLLPKVCTGCMSFAYGTR